MSVRTIRLTLAYDGTDYSGWQVQANARTVQGVIEEALERMHGHPVRIQGAGRTDSGVHATGQVGSFQTDLDSIAAERWQAALNSYLPRDIRVLQSGEAPAGFNAKSSALARAYGYYLFPGAAVPPHLCRYCWRVGRRPAVDRLNRLASVFVGTHDFTTFAAAGDPSRSKVRRVDASAFHPEGALLVYRVTASSFVWKMVRSLVGTMVEYEACGRSPADLAGALEGRRRELAGPSAPAWGLFLEKVLYDE